MELSIDTSTDWGGLAVSQEGRLVAELVWRPGQNHTSELFPRIDQLLSTARTDIKSISAIFVAIGPGSFNGLRAGLSAAKGLAFSLSAPLAGVGTLEIEAYPFAFTGLPVCAVHDAGRGELAAALYKQEKAFKCLKAEHLTTLEQLSAEIKEKTVFCGEIPPADIDKLKKSLGDKAVIPDESLRIRRPSYLAYLGWQRLQSGRSDNPAALQPIYLRQPPITQRKKRF